MKTRRTLVQPAVCGMVGCSPSLPWACGQDAAPAEQTADQNAVNARGRAGDMMADSPVRFPKEGPVPARYPLDAPEQREPLDTKNL